VQHEFVAPGSNFTINFATWIQSIEDTLDQHLRLTPNNYCICAVCTLYPLHRGLANQVNIAAFSTSQPQAKSQRSKPTKRRGNQDKDQGEPTKRPWQPRQVFSGAKTRADAKMHSSMLRLVTKTSVNKKRYKPTVSAIWAQGTRRSTKGCRCTQTATMRPTVIAQVPRTPIPTKWFNKRERDTCA